ncbi:MAG: hypothetical protein HYX51_01195 [Chloroflexi bacterium]|nr:hypothetical protein [Chloroflexota bacterium]
MSRFRITIPFALALTMLVVSACGGGKTESPASGSPGAAATTSKGVDDAAKDTSGSGGTLTIAMSAGNIPYPNTPPNEGFEGRRWVGYQIYDGLANWDLAQGDTVPVPKPGLATDWTIGEDKLTWTVNLRKGVKFHDGADFNAEAVVFQFDRIKKKDFEFYDADMASLNSGNVQELGSYRAIDDYTVEFKTTVPYSFWPYQMAYILFPSPAAVKKWGNKEYVNHPVGTGPFKVDKYVDGQVMELVPNKEYWGNKAKLDRVVLLPMPDPAARLAALQSGQVQWAEVPPPDSKKQLESQNYNIILKQYPHAIIFPLNLQDK